MCMKGEADTCGRDKSPYSVRRRKAERRHSHEFEGKTF